MSRLSVIGCAALLVVCAAALAQAPDREEFLNRGRQFSARIEAAGLAEPFKGITTAGLVDPGLFEIRSTGVSTAPIVDAAKALLGRLNEAQRDAAMFSVDDIEWRKWANQHVYVRQGISFEQMSESQRSAALMMLGAALSAKGLQLSRDIMRLNETLGELNGDNFVEYGEHKYWLSIMGEPSTTEPWGWQLDGHHLNLNYFVLGDQVVMTPAFWGSEPAVAESGKYAGTAVMQAEQDKGREMILALNDRQRREAILMTEKSGNNIMTQAFSDNVVLDYAGVSVASFSPQQKKQLLELIELYIGNLRDEHARVRMSEIEARLEQTWFAWIGGTREDSVYYYRIHSPVVLIEFDHETPANLRHLYPAGVPYREHIHAVVRTPNGNDYGKDLLRQHYAMHPHD